MHDIFLYPPISGVTINTVYLSPAFRSLLFALMGGILTAGTIFHIIKKYPLLIAVRRSFLAAFFAAGLLYAVQADIGWGGWVARDYETYAGLSMDEKLLRMEGGLYDFALRAREVIEGDYFITNHDHGNYASSRLEYFLLPHRLSNDAKNIIVLLDKQAHWDPKKRALTTNHKVFENIEPVLVYTQDAYIVRRP